jgi:hypothetical protein
MRLCLNVCSVRCGVGYGMISSALWMVDEGRERNCGWAGRDAGCVEGSDDAQRLSILADEAGLGLF